MVNKLIACTRLQGLSLSQLLCAKGKQKQQVLVTFNVYSRSSWAAWKKEKKPVGFFLPSVSYSYHVTSVSFDASTVCLVFIPDMEPWITSITLIPRCFTIAPVKEQSSFRKVPLISLHRLSAHKKTQLQAVACVTWSKRGKKRWKMAKW